jgi:hypothetical protein
MSEPNLEQVKGLAEQLSREERGQLWEHLASLPDSGVTTAQLPAPLNFVRKKKAAQGEERVVTFRFEWKINDDGETILTLDGAEIFRIVFNAENCADVLFKKSKIDKPFLRIEPEKEKDYFDRVRAELGVSEAELSDAQIREYVEPALMKTCERLVKQSLESATRDVKGKLPAIVNVTFQKIIHAIYFSGSNTLRDTVGQPETKYTAKEVIEAVFQPDMELVKMLAGVTHGGKRGRKGFWDAEKALTFYRTVEALPRHGADKLQMWEYARDTLRDNDYDHETIQFLLGRPAFADVPEGLLKEAAKVWRQYDDNWDSLPPEKSPQGFAFRHACHKLGYPDDAPYNTLRTKYYEGKKASENKE